MPTNMQVEVVDTWKPVDTMQVYISATAIVDSYSESNYSGAGDEIQIDNGIINSSGGAQSFTGDGGVLNSAKFYLRKVGSPTGNGVAKIYAHTGTFGTSSLPTGAALATSNTFDVSTLTTSLALATFTFSGAEKITLTNTTKYVATFEYSNGDASNLIEAGFDSTSPSHGGNSSYKSDVDWFALDTLDLCFYVYKDTSAWKPVTTAQIQISGAWKSIF